MTPIFNALYKAQNLKAKRRNFRDEVGLLDKLERTHTLCFDVSPIDMAIKDLMINPSEVIDSEWEQMQRRLSLPSDGVFLEGSHLALFVTDGSGDNIRVCLATRNTATTIPNEHEDYFVRYALLALWLINTPNMVRLTNIEAKRKYRASAASASWMSGQYTKVQLCIDGRVIDVNSSHEGQGQRPYHFVRGHIRRLFDRHVWVTGHWRGNKEIGIKHHQYECVSHAPCI